MKTGKKKFRIEFNTIFSRILLFNLFIVIGVTVIPFSAFTNYFINAYNSQINQYNMQVVRQTQNYIDDTMIAKIVGIPNTFFSELDINYELTYPYYNDISNNAVVIQEINNRIHNIMGTYDFISGINVYYLKSNMIFSNSGVSFMNDESFPKTVQGHEQIVDLLKNTGSATQWFTGVVLLSEQDASPGIFVKCLPYSTSVSSRKAVLAISFKQDFFYQFVEEIQLNKNEKLLIVDPQGNVILSTDTKQNQTKLDGDLQQAITQDTSGMLNAKLDGEQSVISFSKSSYNDWIYVSATSVESYYEQSRQMRSLILICLLLLLPINMLLSAVWTKKAHKPLLKILDTIKSFSSEKSSVEENEYRMLENTFKGLNEKVSELSEKLEENRPLIRHNVLLRLLKGNTDNDASTEQEFANIHFAHNCVFCFLLKFFYADEPGPESRLMVEYNIIHLLENDFPYEVKAIMDDSNRLVGIVNFSSSAETDEIQKGISERLQAILNVPCTVCVGESYDFSAEHVHQSYAQAVKAYEYTFLCSDQPILSFTQMKTCVSKCCSQPKNLGRLDEFIRAGNEEAVSALIKSTVMELKQGTYSIDHVKNVLMDMVTVVHMTLNDLGFDENELFGGDIRNCYEKIDSLSNFETWLVDVCTRIMCELHSRRELFGKDMEYKIKNYIHENLYKDISLDNVADALYISPGYLSKIFKNMFGSNFTEYVVNLKMEEAVKLLYQNKLTVKEIANTLGYNSVQYFIRIFREKYGYTPKLYQKTFPREQ